MDPGPTFSWACQGKDSGNHQLKEWAANNCLSYLPEDLRKVMDAIAVCSSNDVQCRFIFKKSRPVWIEGDTVPFSDDFVGDRAAAAAVTQKIAAADHLRNGLSTDDYIQKQIDDWNAEHP
jgi:hypothetical protein